MEMPEGAGVGTPQLYDNQPAPSAPVSGGGRGGRSGKSGRVAKMKVTSMATEVASTSRRTNDGVFHCPSMSPRSSLFLYTSLTM